MENKPKLKNSLSSPYVFWSASAVGAILLGVIIYLNKATFVLVAISFFIAYILNPLVEKLERKGVSRFWAIWLLFLSFILIVVLIFLIIIPQIVTQTQSVMDRAPAWFHLEQRAGDGTVQDATEELTIVQSLVLKAKGAEGMVTEWFVTRIQPMLGDWGITVDENPFSRAKVRDYALNVWNRIKENSDQIIESVGAAIRGTFTGVGSFIVGILNVIMFPVFTFYFIRDYKLIIEGFYRFFPPNWRVVMRDWLGDVDQVLGGFIRGQFSIAVCLAVIYAIGLSILRVPLGAVVGVAAGLANMVPYMSIVVGLVPAILFSLIDDPSLLRVIWIIIIFAGGQMLEGLYLGPKVMSGEVGLHPVVVIVAIIVGGTLFGLPGVILAVPITAVLKVLFIRLHKSWSESWVNEQATGE